MTASFDVVEAILDLRAQVADLRREVEALRGKQAVETVRKVAERGAARPSPKEN